MSPALWLVDNSFHFLSLAGLHEAITAVIDYETLVQNLRLGMRS